MSYLYVAYGVVTAIGLSQQYDARKSQENAARQAQTAAMKNQMLQEEDTNRANARSPDASTMLTANMVAGKSGQSGTMLTGPQGVDPTTLTLSKNTLLGG